MKNTTPRHARRRTLGISLAMVAALVPVTALQAAESAVVEVRIGTSGDDVEELANGWIYRTSSDLELTDDGAPQTIGLRFPGVGVPQGATITAAWIQFTVDETGDQPTDLLVRAVDGPDAPPFEGWHGVSTLGVTSAAVPWNPAPWTRAGASDADQRSPDLSSVVQAIADRPDWTAGNALALVITGTGRRTAVAFDGNPSTAPLLHVEYTTPGEPPGPPPQPVNAPPAVSAVSTATATPGGTITLDGSATDDGLPDPPGALTITWTQIDGPATAPIADPSAIDTTALLPSEGAYTFRLHASDGSLETTADTVSTAVTPHGGTDSIVVAVAASADDVEEQPNGRLYTTSSDLELADDRSTQTIGLRFERLEIPSGARIARAWIQFTVDERDDGPAALEVWAVDADDAAPFSGRHAVSALARTAASVRWAPPPWTAIGDSGPDQRTPDLSPLISAVVERAGWRSGNDLALVITGTGTRTAESYDGSRASAPSLHVEFSTADGPQPANQAPSVAATATDTTAPGATILDGTVADDGLPSPPGALTVTWTQTSGPAAATIADPAAVDTSAELPVAGTYTFELAASDGAASTAVTVAAVAAVPPAVGQIRLAVIGDYGVTGTAPDTVAALIKAAGVDAIVTTGDNVQHDGSIDDLVGSRYSDYIGAYRGAYGSGSPTNRFFPTLGNHDHTDAGGVAAYENYFTLPGDGLTSTSGSERYYDVVLGPVHLFVIDGYRDTTAQRAWLQPRLAASTAAWQIVTVHFPPFSSADANGPSDWVRWPYGQWGADLVLSGHDHVYERFAHDDGTGTIPYVITGLGGAPFDPFGTPTAGSEVRYNASHGALIIDACESGMALRFESVADGGIDSFVVGNGCGVAPEPPPVAADDAHTVDQGALLDVPAPGLLANDTGTGPLTTQLLEPPRHGTLDLGPDGSFSYRHDGTTTTTDTFTYRATGPTGTSDPATVTIAITPTPDAAATIRFAQIGDFGDPYLGEGAVAALVDAMDVDFIITTGDNVQLDRTYDQLVGQFYAEYIGDYRGAYGAGAVTNRFFPSLGPHDYKDSGGTPAYYDFFTLPGSEFSSSSGTERYYDFVWGPVHFFALDGHRDIAPQKVWLQQQLETSDSPWQVVYVHFPPYSSGGNWGSSTWMQWPFEAWGADTVLAGNDQIYERLSFDVDRDGTEIPYLVNGLGGAVIHPLNPPIPGSRFQYNADFGALIVDACDAGMTFTFHSVSDGPIDTVTIGEACPPR